MKIGVYSPYLDTASGGERYMLMIAEVFGQDHQVEVLLDTHLAKMDVDQLKSLNESRHGLDLSAVKFVEAPLGRGSFVLARSRFLNRYDLLFVNCDGGLFYSTAKKGILHFQLPLDRIEADGIWGKIKLASWKYAIYNSKFTQSFIEKLIKIPGEVVYPPVNVERFKVLNKRNYILSVGRFALEGNPKKHDLMIEFFKELYDQGEIKGWSLHLAGGLMEGNKKFLDELEIKAQGYPIHFYPNIGLDDLVTLYGQSAIYWHAMGFEEEDPKRQEHFGISTVEAMASGCVPVVIRAGGQVEIVEDGVSGLLWQTKDELFEKTLSVIRDLKTRVRLSEAAVKRSANFSQAEFVRKIKKLAE